MKRYNYKSHIIALFAMILFVTTSCDNGWYIKYAEDAFIEGCSYMSERDANSKEINYWKEPRITQKRYVRSYTGRDLVHFCNRVEELNNYSREHSLHLGPIQLYRYFAVDDIKKFALDNIDKNTIAYQYYFSGVFTTYDSKTQYSTQTANALVIPKLRKTIIFNEEGNGIAVYASREF